MTMWRSNEPVEDNMSDLPGIDFKNKCRRARRRAWRDGLSDQTVVKTLESVRSYRAFERALVGSVDPRTVIELALVHRLASLLWRLRRASAIETGLFEMHAELRLARRQDRPRGPGQPGTLQTLTQANGHKVAPGLNGRDDPPASGQESPSMSMRPSPASSSKSSAIAQCFLRLSHLDPTLLDRVGSYEATLWRQAAQTIWSLEAMRQPPRGPTRRPFRKPGVLSYWDAERSRVK
jgi:hypothetical protein